MDFSFEKDQELIRKSSKEFFEKECPKDKVRELKEDTLGYDPKVWKKMVDLGHVGLVIPEAYGGTEGNFIDIMILMEEMGRNIVPCPYFPTVVLCGFPLLKFGTEAQKKDHLKKIAEKGQIWTLALHEDAVNYEPSDITLSAVANGDKFVLNGKKLFVPFANVAEKLIVIARTLASEKGSTGITAFIVDAKTPGISVEVIPTTARDKQCEVVFKDVAVPAADILGKKDEGWEVIEFLLYQGTALKCAEISGSAQAALQITNQYVKERTQFDKPIGSFQAIQHRLVDNLTEVDAVKNLVYEVAWRINEGIPSKREVSSLKVKANGAHHRICYNGIVSHGAIGFTEEMDIGLYHLRSRTFEFDMGSTDFHLNRIADELKNHQPEFLNLYNK